MATLASELSVHGRWSTAQDSGYLAVSHSVNRMGEDFFIEIWSFLPIGGGKGLSGEGSGA